MSRYKKTIAAVVGALIAFATLVVGSPAPGVTAPELLTGAVLLATALGVYGATNEG